MADVRKYTEQIAGARKERTSELRLFLQSMRCLMRIIHTIRQRRTSRQHKSQSMQT